MRRRPTLSPAERRIATSAYTNMTITLIGRYRCVDTVLKNQFNLGYSQARSVIKRRDANRSFADGRRWVGHRAGAAAFVRATVGRPASEHATHLSGQRRCDSVRDVDSFAVNRANWDERAPAHAASADYGLQRFIDDPDALSDVVRFDRPRLGDIAGLRGVHLQCHIGTDTLSLARLGARMTGLDFSSAALVEARRLAASAGTDVDFVESDVYGAPDALGHEVFDLVYTGIGALIWLPDIRRWAETVAALLRPGGRLFLREGHPMLFTIDETVTDALVVRYPYVETVEPLVFDEDTTYVETTHLLTNTTTHEWNHGLGEVVTALLDVGMRLTMLVEHDSVPWMALPEQMRLGCGRRVATRRSSRALAVDVHAAGSEASGVRAARPHTPCSPSTRAAMTARVFRGR